LRGAAGDDVIDTRGGGAGHRRLRRRHRQPPRVDETDVVSALRDDRAARRRPRPWLRHPRWSTPIATAPSRAPTATTGVPTFTPGARDVPGNRIDEDCSGADAAFTLIPARLSFNWLGRSDGTTKADSLSVRDVPAGGRVELRCSGRGCPFKARTREGDEGTRQPPQAAPAPRAREGRRRDPRDRAGVHRPAHPLHDARQGPPAEEGDALLAPGAKPARCA
jgi:hypothetical protein